MRLSNVNIDTDIDGAFYALHFIPLTAKKIVLTDVMADLVLESTTPDGIHWYLHDVTQMHVGSVNITFANKYFTRFVHLFDNCVNKLVNKLMPELSKLVDTEINALNKMVAMESWFTWDFALLGKNYPLNMTQTTAPSLVKDSHLIKLNFDGTFHPDSSIIDEPYYHPYFPDLNKTHRE